MLDINALTISAVIFSFYFLFNKFSKTMKSEQVTKTFASDIFLLCAHSERSARLPHASLCRDLNFATHSIPRACRAQICTRLFMNLYGQKSPFFVSNHT